MKLLVAFIMLLSGTAFAQLRCMDKLLPTGRHSSAHQLISQEWRPTSTSPISAADVSRALHTLVFGKLLCRANEIEIDATPSCAIIDPAKPEWVICQNNSSLGHFVLTGDISQSMNIIFHKAPRPVEPETEATEP